MGKGPAKQSAKQLPLTVPVAQYEYLTYLAKNSYLGTRETEVASHILTEAIRQMIKEGFHSIAFPRDGGSSDGGDDDA